MLKVNNRNTRTRCEIYSKTTIKTPERRQWCRSGVFVVNLEHISHLVLLFLLLTWASKCWLGKLCLCIWYLFYDCSISFHCVAYFSEKTFAMKKIKLNKNIKNINIKKIPQTSKLFNSYVASELRPKWLKNFFHHYKATVKMKEVRDSIKASREILPSGKPCYYQATLRSKIQI